MALTDTFKGACAVAFVATVACACGGDRRDVQVPGAAPAVVPASPTGVDGDPTDLFTARTTIAPSQTAEEAADATPTTGVTQTLPTTTSTPPIVAAPSPTPPAAGVPTGVVPTVTGWAAFDLHLQTILDSGSSAVSATVLLDGEIVHEVALGSRTIGGDAVSVGDRYRVASISKVVTAIAMLRLVEQGVIGLDDPVGRRLASRVGIPSPVEGVDRITTRHLLTHRSGIGQYENLVFRRQVESCEAATATGLSRPLERAPGTTLRYSNLNFCMLGLLIDDLTGRPYGDVVRDEVLSPLGVDGMRLAGTFDVGDREVEHRSEAGRNYMEVLGAAGSWLASPTDVAVIIDSLDHATPGWKPLGPDTAAMMQTITQDPPLPPEVAATTSTTLEPSPPPTSGYGMGLMIFGPGSYGHTGTLESTHVMTVRRDDGLTWAITVSGDHPSSSRDLAGVIADGLRYAGIR